MTWPTRSGSGRADRRSGSSGCGRRTAPRWRTRSGYYPSTLFPGLLQRELGSLYDVFANEYGVVVTSGEQTVRAESADAHQARILGIAKRAPLLVQERVTHAGDRAIELSTSWYRADRYRIHMAITPRGARES